jgi:hypothetical protein
MADNLEHKIRERAYQLWVQEGRLDGRDLEHWLEAERSVGSEGEPAARRRRGAAGGAAKTTVRPRKKSGSPARTE